MIKEEQGYRGGQVFCSNCGRSNSPYVRFCPHCGAHCGPAMGTEQGSISVDLTTAEYMGFWIRLAAWIIDSLILFVAQIIVPLLGPAFLSFIIGPIYGVLFIGLKGQTPGKMAMGIQVVNRQGEVPGIRAALREIIGKLLSGVFIFLGFFWIAWDPHKRGWHDHIGGTYVVRKPRYRE